MSTLNVYSINGGPVGGMRNALINGNPTINQRGYVSGTATGGANQYTLDRWRVVTSGQSITWTDSENIRTVTAPAGGVEQVVEGSNLGTGTYALSWTGTATATVGGVTVANGTTVSITGGVDTTVRFSGGTFSLAQLEPGTRATQFERRPIGTELALCQRYYIAETLSNIRYGRDVAIGKQSTVWVDFPVTMRVAPTTTQATTSSVGNQVASSTNNSITIRAANVTNDMATLASYTASAEL
jgi:hypothetical protein